LKPAWLPAVLITLGGALIGVFFWRYLAPLDLWVSGIFYEPGHGFVYSDRPAVEWIYWATFRVVDVLGVLILGGLIASIVSWRLHAWRAPMAFLVLSMILGPGLITNQVFKAHWGRPRPSQIVNFGGSHPYVAPLIISHECDHNCSFVSGHAAAAFWLLTPALVFRRRRRLWWMAGLEWGLLVSAVRIIQGGHFLSDVVGALIVVLLTNRALLALFQRYHWSIEAPEIEHHLFTRAR
jgi:lipid A 4'-phosphatase